MASWVRGDLRVERRIVGRVESEKQIRAGSTGRTQVKAGRGTGLGACSVVKHGGPCGDETARRRAPAGRDRSALQPEDTG